MVRSRTLGFLAGSDDRLLVTMSRAKDYLFVLANGRALCQDPMWRRLHEAATQPPHQFQLHSVDRGAAAAFDMLGDRGYCRRLANMTS
ncbi:TPA: hypothetical protein N0F65_009070 [Lagenidium giganteum]|uniref:Uncharacterized protein n=1 Tax=Lagenidium giganteum TaxID=4803 RepID=A0AAV2YQ22_9STRA|nr:TPA: hypothetical protein N0F65_009070 [Lagenidium giganteum]